MVETRYRKPTIADVAADAEVSISTVSRVMNGLSTVDPVLVEKVTSSAKRLNYAPSQIARSLAIGKTNTIGIVLPDISNPTFQGILSGLTKAASPTRYRVLVADSSESPADEVLLSMEVRRRCDALVLIAPRMSDAELEAVVRETYPVVLVNRPGSSDVPSVSANYEAGIQSLAEHLLALGHTEFIYLEGSPASASNKQRLRGLEQFSRLHPETSISMLPTGVSLAAGQDATARVRESGATAVLAFNDLVALGLLNGLLEAGARVPEDVSIVGFDDIPFARYSSPSLTTASVPVDEIGRLAWGQLNDILGGKTSRSNLILLPSLALRGSSGPPKTLR